MYKQILLSSFLFLGACSTVIDKSVQDIEFRTPGAHGARCDVYVDGLRYKVHPPQKIGVYKSKKDLRVDCKAPGNRHRELFIKPKLSDASKWNLATAGVGYVYDYASNALFQYPSIITVDFTGAPVLMEDLPAQNSPDIRQPEEYDLEEFLPAQPRLNSDKNKIEARILRRGESPYYDGGNDHASTSPEVLSEMPARTKGDLMDAKRSSGAPVPLIPGQ